MVIEFTRKFAVCLIIVWLILVLGACSKSKSSNSGNILSGTIIAFDGSSIDSDVNDPNAPHESNDSLSSAQSLSNPVSLGGYVNRPGAGAEGRSFASGDVNDYFSANLLQNQVISLQISDAGSGNPVNLDLLLLDKQGNELAASTTNGASESITVSTTGEYIIQVTAISGASIYNLSVGLDASVASPGAAGASEAFSAYPDLNVDAEFVPGEIIVRFKSAGSQSKGQKNLQASGISIASKVDALGLTHLAGELSRSVLLVVPEGQASFRALGIQMTTAAVDDRQKKTDTLNVISALRQRDDVVFASPNYIRHATQVPNDTEYGKQWHYPIINLPQAWDITTGNSDVIVGVIDTGVLLNHPDIDDQIVGGFDFIVNRDRRDNERDATPGIDNDANDPGDGISSSSSFHGTHVAGTIAAETNNATAVAGIAWNVKIMPLRVLGPFGGSDYDIGQAVLYAAGLPNDSGIELAPAQRADILNLSLGGPIDVNDIPGLIEPFKQARDAGVIIIAAAGNEGKNALYYPASLEGVVSVSATNISKKLASYSNFGSTVDVSAPGGDSGDLNGDGFFDGVFSLSADDSVDPLVYGTNLAAGTSMAAPHVAGVVALMKSVFPTMTPDQFDALLVNGDLTQDLGVPGRDDSFGHGMIDALKALEAAIKAAGGDIPIIAAVATAFPSSLNFSTSRSTIAFSLNNGGNVDNLLVQNIANDSSGWLTVEAIDSLVDSATGLGFYNAIIDRTKLPQNAKTLTADISVVHTIGGVEAALIIPVIAQSSAGNFANNAGRHYVLLIDPDATPDVNDTVPSEASVAVPVTQGRYNFTLRDVASGGYLVVAGSDLDNDNVVCDAGEACGKYPTLDNPSVIDVNSENLGNAIAGSTGMGAINGAGTTTIQFETGFSLRLGAGQTQVKKLMFKRSGN